MRFMNSSAIFVLRSVNSAVKAKKLLVASGFGVNIIKQASKDGDGCHYGITLKKSDSDTALEILEKNGISPLQILFD